MQVLQPFFKTLYTLNILPGWSKGYDFLVSSLPISENINSPTSLCTVLLDFESSSKETSFCLFLVVETGKTYPGVAVSSTF